MPAKLMRLYHERIAAIYSALLRRIPFLKHCTMVSKRKMFTYDIKYLQNLIQLSKPSSRKAIRGFHDIFGVTF